MTGLDDRAAMASGWCMARRRGADRWRPLILTVAGVLATFLLAGAIQLGNSITAMRSEVQELNRAIDNVEAEQANLSVAWNTETSRKVIMSRARKLRLTCVEAPATLVVAAADVSSPRDLRDIWSRLAWHDPTPAAVAAEVAR